MGRPPLPIGTWGNISVSGKAGAYVARTRFRDFDGVTRMAKRTGATKGAARAALTAHLSDRSAPSGDAITGDTRLSDVWLVWFAERTAPNAQRPLTTNTQTRYREVWNDHILPGVGNLRVREATVTRLDAFVKSVAENTGASTAKMSGSILSGVMGLAVRHGATRANPMRDVAGVTVTAKEPRALTLDEVKALRASIIEWQAGVNGRYRRTPILDLVDVLLATGARIGEVLALRWQDVDLDAGTVTIAGTIIKSDEKPSRPIRQPFPKGKKPVTLLLPQFAVDVFLRLRVNMVPNVHDAVFPSANGTWRDSRNVRKSLDKALAASGLDWVTPHTFRKTVATVIENESGLRSAAGQMNHGSEDMTRRHYVARAATAPDNRGALNKFAPTKETP